MWRNLVCMKSAANHVLTLSSVARFLAPCSACVSPSQCGAGGFYCSILNFSIDSLATELCFLIQLWRLYRQIANARRTRYWVGAPNQPAKWSVGDVQEVNRNLALKANANKEDNYDYHDGLGCCDFFVSRFPHICGRAKEIRQSRE